MFIAILGLVILATVGLIKYTICKKPLLWFILRCYIKTKAARLLKRAKDLFIRGQIDEVFFTVSYENTPYRKKTFDGQRNIRTVNDLKSFAKKLQKTHRLINADFKLRAYCRYRISGIPYRTVFPIMIYSNIDREIHLLDDTYHGTHLNEIRSAVMYNLTSGEHSDLTYVCREFMGPGSDFNTGGLYFDVNMLFQFVTYNIQPTDTVVLEMIDLYEDSPKTYTPNDRLGTRMF